MLDKNVFAEGIVELSLAYPTWTMQVDNRDAMAVWYKYFKNMEDDQFLETAQNYIKASAYVPTISGLLEHRAPRKNPVEVEVVEVMR